MTVQSACTEIALIISSLNAMLIELLEGTQDNEYFLRYMTASGKIIGISNRKRLDDDALSDKLQIVS